MLRDAPLFYPGYTNVTPLLPEGSCRHLWCAKENQAVLPALDARPKPDTKYKFAGVCRKCRNHVELEINYGINWESEPCPNATHPLHHLVHSPWREGVTRNGSQLEKSPPYTETFAFQCSSPTCSAAVSVRYKPPVLKDEHVQLLTDTALLSQRTREVIDAEPARFEGHKTPTSAEVLSDLRSYLRNSWEHREPRPIRVDNKRFALRFGQEGQACKEVLDFLNFKHDPPDYWLPPRINVDDPVPFKDPVNTFIDDVVLELSVLISQMPEDARGQSHENSNLPAADRSLFRILGAQDYDKHPSARTAVQDPSTRHICYTALGTPEDASDELVSFAYRAQIRTNPAAGPTYLTYLRQIAESRSSELLETLVATEYSAGNFDSDQLNQAYRYFSLSPNQELTDELIIGTFQSRLQDAAKHEADMRAQLKIIGQHRNSQRIKDVADDGKPTHQAVLL